MQFDPVVKLPVGRGIRGSVRSHDLADVNAAPVGRLCRQREPPTQFSYAHRDKNGKRGGDGDDTTFHFTAEKRFIFRFRSVAERKLRYRRVLRAVMRRFA